MTQQLKTYFNWSTGKDASLALYHLMQDERYQVDQLITSINSHHNRVSMHGLRRELLEKQVEEIGLPLTTLELPEEPTMEEYEHLMKNQVSTLVNEEYTHSGFGDIFLEDLKVYRENQLKPYGITGCFPLWKRDTKEIIQEFLSLGFKAVVVCIKADLLDESFVGRELTQEFVDDLPKEVDPCGENGEFHTFCFDGPIFKNPIHYQLGEKIYREYKNPDTNNTPNSKNSLGFWFCDILLNDE